MLRSANELRGYSLAAADGEIGRCQDFLFDDETWTVRYMVADTSKWLPGQQVLISPISLGEPDWSARLLPVRLTKKQIKEAPHLEQHAPVSRQYEVQFHTYYGWPYYWGGAHTWGIAPYPGDLFEEKRRVDIQEKSESEDCHLRSMGSVEGYYIKTLDGEMGHVKDFIVDDQSWSVRYFVVDTRNWLPGKQVLASPKWIKNIDWKSSDVEVNLNSEQVKNGPEYDPNMPINREYETRLYDFYGRPHDW